MDGSIAKKVEMPVLNLPSFNWDIREGTRTMTIFDPLRKKHIVLTPEEWVRQHFVQYLIQHLGYPRSLIQLERAHAYNTLTKRTDILVYDRVGAPYMLIECKASHIKIEDKVFRQASVYNKSIKAKYLVVTNGIQHFCCVIDHLNNNFKFIDTLPKYGL